MNEAQNALIGKQVTVTVQGGQTETVTVKQFTMKDTPAVLDAYPNMIRVVELACVTDLGPAPAGWASMLTVRSFGEVLSAVEEVNADFFDVCKRLLQPISRIVGLEVKPAG